MLRLTPAEESQAGSAFTTNSIPLGPSYEFSTFFQFQMTDPGIYGASDGMTFTFQSESATALGVGGGGLGYQNITPSVAVEFNTWQNVPYDINDNDVAVLTNGNITGLGRNTVRDYRLQPSRRVWLHVQWGSLVGLDRKQRQDAARGHAIIRPRARPIWSATH